MDTFDEWVKTAQYPCIQEWGRKLVDSLGASWDSFRRDNKDQITRDLVEGGIPLLAARDIVDIATEEVQKSTAPMAVFWDLENMSIPTALSGRDMTSVLKNILAPHGDMIQFRAYASIGLNLIPQEKRSDLQLSGCHLVDCPHHGRKEVADKMIIVDAMHFAYQHPDAATLCFITGDVDYAYLLAVLQQRPQWRTIVISRGTMQSMLHVNCHMKIRWETDVLQKIYSSREETAEDGGDLEPIENRESIDGAEDKDHHQDPFAPLSAEGVWKDDVELLREIMVQEGRRAGTKTLRKSQVGNALRQTNPARFPTRESIKLFFAQAIERGVITETGDGAFKTVALVDNKFFYNQSSWLPVSVASPLPRDEIPTKALDMASKGLPFILFIRKMHCPSGSPLQGTYIQSTEFWLLLLYPSKELVQKALMSHAWLRNGTLVDWRNVVTTNENSCSVCDAQCSGTDRSAAVIGGKLFCSKECIIWSDYDSYRKIDAVECTVDTLKFLAANDDLYTPRNVLINIVFSRHQEACSNNKKYARLWVKEAVRRGKAIELKRIDTKTKIVCLPENESQASEEFQPDDVYTAGKESFVQNLLWRKDNAGALDRQDVARELKLSFDDMGTAVRRSWLLMTLQAEGKLFIHKTPFLHIVALTKEQAEAAEATCEYQMSQKNSCPSMPAVINTHRRIDSDSAGKSSPKSSQSESENDGQGLDSGNSSSSSEVDLITLLSKEQSSTRTPATPDVGGDCVEATNKPKPISFSTILTGEENSQSETSNTKPQIQLKRRVDENGNTACKSLHVSGFGEGTAQKDIKGLFASGYCDFDVVLKSSGPCSFAFVNMASQQDAMDARLRLHNRVLKGGRLKINFAKR